ncbi:hypothetical protein NKH77_17885 [Streptomyces sp. M19]
MSSLPEQPFTSAAWSRRAVLRGAAVAGGLAVPPRGRPPRPAHRPRRPRCPPGSPRTAARTSTGPARPPTTGCGPAPRAPRGRGGPRRLGRAAGWRLRPRGRSHTWAPLTISPAPPGRPGAARVLLVDTVKHLTALRLERAEPPAWSAPRPG